MPYTTLPLLSPLSSLKRRELQALAKENGLSANATSEDLISQLSSLSNVSRTLTTDSEDTIKSGSQTLTRERTQEINTLFAPAFSSSFVVTLLFVAMAYLSFEYKQLQHANEILRGQVSQYEQEIETMAEDKRTLLGQLNVFRRSTEDAEQILGTCRKEFISFRAVTNSSFAEILLSEYDDDCKRSVSTLNTMLFSQQQTYTTSGLNDELLNMKMCWLDALLSTESAHSCAEALKRYEASPPKSEEASGNAGQKKEVLICPFTDVEDALRNVRLREEWIQLQESDINSKQRRRLFNSLSVAFHPDKIHNKGCPKEYGHRIMIELNDFRDSKQGSNAR